MIGVVLLSIPLGYFAHEAKIVQSRTDWLANHQNSARIITAEPLHEFYPAHPDKVPSVVRRWLGDKQYWSIIVASESDLRQATVLFPEADVILVEPILDETNLPWKHHLLPPSNT